ncbi:SRPBCC family protein [Shimazuella kribbensis]|uniref:SRPBCC family protein n=1 Tax=Shimazuella kribbensis TaxID=139808 RepID=UPI00048FCCAC|nr:SRPBCC domain-containing protein [Shimazuella kribbensis]
MSKQNELVTTRIFDTSRELVFKAFTETEHLKHWWGPGYMMNVIKFDLRPGGVFHYIKRSPGGGEMWNKFVYREIIEPERLVYTNSFCDEEGKTIRAPFGPTWPMEILNTFTFIEQKGKTMLTMRAVPLSATEEELKTFEAAHDMVQMGFEGLLDLLGGYLARVYNL